MKRKVKVELTISEDDFETPLEAYEAIADAVGNVADTFTIDQTNLNGDSWQEEP